MIRRPLTAGLITLVTLALLITPGCQKPPTSAEGAAGAIQQKLARARRAAFWRPRNVEAQVALGKAAYDAGLYNDAYAAYRRAAAIKTDHFDVCLGLAQVNAKLHDPSEALDWLARARRLQPDSFEAAQLEGRLVLMSGRFDDAVVALRRALKIKPDSAATWLNLSSAYAAQGRRQEAVTAAQEALRLQPQIAVTHLALAMHQRRAGNLAAAEQAFRAVLKLDKDNAPAMVALAEVLVERKRKLEEARQLATRATDFEAERPRAAVVAAWAMHLQGDTQRGANELIKLVNSNPHNPDAWRKLAIMLRRLGREADARKADDMTKVYVSAGSTIEGYSERQDGRPEKARD